MRLRTAILSSLVLLGACAHVPARPDPLSSPSPAGSPEPPVSTRVSLPYKFWRHGVEIRVDSVEFQETQLQVNVSLQETRGESVELSAAPLIEARTSAGDVLPLLRLTQAGQAAAGLTIRLQPKERSSASFSYQPPQGAAREAAVELRFPTGKWWSST